MITIPSAPSLRVQGRLLVAASWAFLPLILLFTVGTVLVFVLAGADIPPGEPVTRAAYDDYPLMAWRQILVGWALVPPMALAAIAAVQSARAVRRRAPAVAVTTVAAALLTLAATLVYAVFWHLSVFFTEPTILEDPARRVALVAFGFVAMPCAFLAAAGTALCLRAQGAAPRATAGIAITGAVLGIAYLALRGIGEVPVPPAVVVVLWIPLGILALRAGRPARAPGRRTRALSTPAVG